jgi:hypothetical protein
MNNAEIARKLSWVNAVLNQVWGQPRSVNTRDAHYLNLKAADEAFNSVQAALASTLKMEPTWMGRPGWRDALEIQLLYAEDQAREAARKAKIDVDDIETP